MATAKHPAFRWRGQLRDASRRGAHAAPPRIPQRPAVTVSDVTYAGIAVYAHRHNVTMQAVLAALLADLPVPRRRAA